MAKWPSSGVQLILIAEEERKEKLIIDQSMQQMGGEAWQLHDD
jgi:hypothetical protein